MLPVRLMMSCMSSTMGLSDEELAAEFIRRAAFVDANALLKDECGVIVNMSVWAFFKLDNPDMWVSNTGRFHTNEELVAILRDATGSIQVVDACDLH